MKSFPIETLKDYLGRDLIESLLEWSTGKETFLTKAKLIDMILCIHGVNILQHKEFRSQLLKALPVKEILEFRLDLPGKYHNSNELKEIAEAASNVPWKKSNVNKRLLQLLDYNPDEIFIKNESIYDAINIVESYDEFFELLDYQYIIRQRALHILSSSKQLSRFLIHMPTGTGKTKTATHIIAHHYNYNLKKKGLVIWIAHTTELLQQAYDSFVSVWKNIGNGKIKTYKLWGGYSIEDYSDELSGFMVCGIQKLQSLNKNNPEYFKKLVNNACLIVYDEAHKASATETRNIINKFMIRKEGMRNRSLMGLTATPGRSTEVSIDNALLASMFENRILSIDTKLMNDVNLLPGEAANVQIENDVIRYFQNRGVLAKIKKEELRYPESLSEAEINSIKVIATSNGYDDFSPKALEIIGKNKSRNLRILQKIRELNRDGIPTIVFACSVTHGQLLSSMLTLENIPNALIIGEMLEKDRSDAIADFKNNKMNILINYAVLTTGFDATNIQCVFIARPTQSVVLYSQMLGRGLRGPQMGGNETCLLVDIKDNLKQFDENMAFSHFNNYWKI